jgi:hypothetical protein
VLPAADSLDFIGSALVFFSGILSGAAFSYYDDYVKIYPQIFHF